MITYIAILRGINVSGKRIIKMDALKQLFSTLGYKSIRTYIQSGNVVFEAKKTIIKQLEASIKNEIEAQFGFDVPVLILEINELKSVIDNNPFVTNKLIDPSHLHITFLSEEPSSKTAADISVTAYLPDEFSIIDKAVYLYCPNGYGNTKLNNNFFEKKLKLNGTTRNWKTVNELRTLTNS